MLETQQQYNFKQTIMHFLQYIKSLSAIRIMLTNQNQNFLVFMLQKI